MILDIGDQQSGSGSCSLEWPWYYTVYMKGKDLLTWCEIPFSCGLEYGSDRRQMIIELGSLWIFYSMLSCSGRLDISEESYITVDQHKVHAGSWNVIRYTSSEIRQKKYPGMPHISPQRVNEIYLDLWISNAKDTYRIPPHSGACHYIRNRSFGEYFVWKCSQV